MHQVPRLVERDPGIFVGIRMEMSLMEDKTHLLWRSFMPRRHEVMHRRNTDFVSLQVYPGDYFMEFDRSRGFEKWALVEVESVTMPVEEEFGHSIAEKGEMVGRRDGVPEGMEVFELKGGMYAVFVHSGGDPAIFDYIYGTWLPDSDFELDMRPHFEVLDAQYRHSDPDASEEIWIPVRLKDQALSASTNKKTPE